MDVEKVKKALECCQVSMSDSDPFGKCIDCPYNDESIFVEDCRAILSRDALEVIVNVSKSMQGLPGSETAVSRPVQAVPGIQKRA